MDNKKIESIEIMDELIQGRVDPSIYAFVTNTVPNFLKIGDTYRPVSTRLNEWKRFYPDLIKQFEDKAIISDDIYFRDYSVHSYLENDLFKARLKPSDVQSGYYYSKEFFKDTNTNDVKEAITDIKESYKNGISKYEYYSTKNRLPQVYHYQRQDIWTLRPNQQKAVDEFLKAVRNGRTNLLMYAVMRFGKSFTSLCCAHEMGSKITLIVSAKADVKDEWKKTVESAGNFKDFVFLESNDLLRNSNIIQEMLSSEKKVVLFLTLQDLQGGHIKEKHSQIFGKEIDLLIVDETHFGARAESFGAILRDEQNNITKLDDEIIDSVEAIDQIKVLNPKIKLHLSGTPYRILMGSEFEKEDIISFIQFSDIVKEQEDWDKDNLSNDNVDEWDNPYFGFPKMVRFAFNANQSSIDKMNTLKKQGVSFAFSGLFKPLSIKKDIKNNDHKKFMHEEEILDLLQVIDGSKEDTNLLSFLDYDKIKDGKMCRHIVMVLPYCASCDAMEQLILKNCDSFKNLNQYEIVNISGVEGSSYYRNPTDIKNVIKKHEKNNKKTLTLTVNRMLTGSTVEEWDTMIYFKDTASPQEYDQAIFRLQNQYIRTLSSGNQIIKENLKPQTLLVDFDPNRLFRMQEQKSLIYNVNTEQNGNSKLEERIREELRISPIITMNHNKIYQVQATNILEAVSNYNKNRSVPDEVSDLPIDMSILNDEVIKNAIKVQSDFNSKEGLTLNSTDGDGDDLEVEKPDSSKKNKVNEVDSEQSDFSDTSNSDNQNDKNFDKKIQTYYLRILFFSFLSNQEVTSLDDIIDILQKENNIRLSKNLSLDLEVLKRIAIVMDPFVRSSLDYKIQNISKLANDLTLSPIERAMISLNKFDRMSASEIITSAEVCDEMINLIPEKSLRQVINNKDKLLDIGGKSGEYAVSLYKRLTEKMGFKHDNVRDSIYSIPTSPIAYEFTRRFYEILDLNIENIITKFNVYDLLNVLDERNQVDYSKIHLILCQNKKFNQISLDDIPMKGDKMVKFGAIVGNPPYHIKDGGAAASAKPIYHEFVMLSKEINPDYATFITPTRWFSGGKGLDGFRDMMLADKSIKELHDILTPEDVFPVTNNRGGVCYYLFEKQKKDDEVRIVTHKHGEIISDVKRPMLSKNINIFIRDSIGVDVINKVFKGNFKNNFSKIVSPRKPFGVESNIINTDKFKNTKNQMISPVKCIGRNQVSGYLEEENITSHKEWINVWKVFVPRANNIGTELNDDNLNVFIGEPGTICTEAYIAVGADYTLDEKKANSICKFLKTKLVRFLHKQAKAGQDASRKTYQFIPLLDFETDNDIDWSKEINEIDKQLFKKYQLTIEEINHVTSTIKDMDL